MPIGVYVKIFDLSIIWVKVNPSLSFFKLYWAHVPSATYQALGPLALRFFFYMTGHKGHLGHVTQMQQTIFGSPYPLRLHVKYALIGPVVSEEMFIVFSLYESMKNKWPLGWTIFDPSAIIWTILVEAHNIKLPTKYQRPWPSNFRQEDSLSFAYGSLCKNNWPFCKNGQGQHKVIIFSNFIRPMSLML